MATPPRRPADDGSDRFEELLAATPPAELEELLLDAVHQVRDLAELFDDERPRTGDD